MLPLLAQALNDIPADSARKIAVTVIVSVVTGLLSFLFGRYYGRYRAGREWARKEFLGRVTVSLNVFADGFLKIRTVMERSLEEIFLNQLAVEKVLAAAKRTTADNPILPVPKADRWYLLNFVLNAVAEHFVDGQIRMDAGVGVTKVRYALFLTCEQVGDERIRKVRAMLVKEEHLTNYPYPDGLPKLENPWHDVRVRTLRQAAELYKAEPDNFLVLEACV
jgi:hypothetical protein